VIVTSRTLTCNFCAEWRPIGDTETAREARKRAQRAGWRTLPNADQGGRLMDVCPKRDARHPTPAGS
jgi:Fe-S-cluster-containing hydrogenase component 2